MIFIKLPRLSTSALNLIVSRSISTSKVLNSTKKSPLFLLRQKTGLAYNLCREALNKHDNNVEEARVWLEAQAMAHGLQKASKVRGRSAREGLLGIAISRDNKMASIIELNCETDFVAKNQLFKDFASDIIEQFAHMASNEPITDQAKSIVQRIEPSEDQVRIIQDQIPPLISKLGENIKMNRAQHFRVLDDRTHIFGQVHAKAAAKESSHHMIILGRFGALVGLQSGSSGQQDSLKLIGARLCQHVIGYNPTYIELPDPLRKQLEAAEIEKRAAEADEEKKEESGEYSDTDEDERLSSEARGRDDWPSIMDQTLIMSDDQSVRDFCKAKNISIVYFSRFECGISDAD